MYKQQYLKKNKKGKILDKLKFNQKSSFLGKPDSYYIEHVSYFLGIHVKVVQSGDQTAWLLKCAAECVMMLTVDYRVHDKISCQDNTADYADKTKRFGQYKVLYLTNIEITFISAPKIGILRNKSQSFH